MNNNENSIETINIKISDYIVYLHNVSKIKAKNINKDVVSKMKYKLSKYLISTPLNSPVKENTRQCPLAPLRKRKFLDFNSV